MSEPVYDRWGVSVYHGDNLDVLRDMPDCSIDAVVTDPPAGIGFMREWDNARGGRNQWVAWLTERMAEVNRVLKPGGFALVWSIPRTSHWTATALEDGGFEIRDVIQHEFENGMPKSRDVAVEIDRRPGVARHAEFGAMLKQARLAKGYTNSFDVAERVVGARTGAVANWEKYQFPEAKWWPALRDLLDLDSSWDAVVAEASRAKVGSRTMNRLAVAPGQRSERPTITRDVTAAATDEAQRWIGWGTALRPAAEPWWLARKQLGAQTVAANVLTYGTGAINIDATRGRDGQWPANVAKFPKAPPSERPMVNGEQHPTVKSVALCRWLVRLVTPPGGTVLDPFAGTGPVGQAARAESMKAVLIEQDAQSIGFIRARLDARAKTEAGATADDGEPVDLLDLLGGDAS